MNKLIQLASLLLLVSFLLFYTTSCTADTDDASNTEETIRFKNKDNTVYMRLAGEPDRLNPFLTTNSYARSVHGHIFQNLLTYDQHTLKEIPALAKSHPIIETTEDGGVNYTYELFDNATWSDGKAVTAQDVIFTLKAMLNLNVAEAAPFRPGFYFITDAKAAPDNNKKFTIYTNDTYFLAESSINSLTILPAHIFDPSHLMQQYQLADIISKGETLADEADMKAFADLFTSAAYSRDGDKLVGSGPYSLVSWIEGQSINLTKVDNWWAEKGHPNLVAYPDSLVYRIIGQQSTAVNALKDELIDVNVQVDANDFVALKTNEFVSEHYDFYAPDTYAYYYIALNNGEPKLSDKRVRRALAHLIDLDFLINKQFQGLATKLNNTPVLPSKPYFDTRLKTIAFDVEKAKILLTEAGWKDSNGNGTIDKEIDGKQVELELDYLVPPGSKFGNIMAELLQDNASQAGIQINIIPRDVRAMLQEEVAARAYDMFGLGAVSFPHPDDFNQLWHTSSNTPRGGNRVQFGNAESDALIDKIRITLDEKEREPLYKEFQKIIYDEQPMIFLFSPKERIIISKRFEATTTPLRPGFQPNTFKLRD